MDKKLMKLFLECPNTVREVILTDNQVRILRSIRDFEHPSITTSEFSNIGGGSIQKASIMLARLSQKGYLKRVERVAKTGGIEYSYSCAIDFK